MIERIFMFTFNCVLMILWESPWAIRTSNLILAQFWMSYASVANAKCKKRKHTRKSNLIHASIPNRTWLLFHKLIFVCSHRFLVVWKCLKASILISIQLRISSMRSMEVPVHQFVCILHPMGLSIIHAKHIFELLGNSSFGSFLSKDTNGSSSSSSFFMEKANKFQFK